MALDLDTPGAMIIVRSHALPVATARTLRDMARAGRKTLARRALGAWSTEDELAVHSIVTAKRAIRALRDAFPRVRSW